MYFSMFGILFLDFCSALEAANALVVSRKARAAGDESLSALSVK